MCKTQVAVAGDRTQQRLPGQNEDQTVRRPGWERVAAMTFVEDTRNSWSRRLAVAAVAAAALSGLIGGAGG